MPLVMAAMAMGVVAAVAVMAMGVVAAVKVTVVVAAENAAENAAVNAALNAAVGWVGFVVIAVAAVVVAKAGPVRVGAVATRARRKRPQGAMGD